MSHFDDSEDYYAVLEIQFSATFDDIKKSYRKLSLRFHPDKNPSDPTATAYFQLLNRAHETLKDKALRSVYDLRWPGIARNLRANKLNGRTQEENARRYEEDEKDRDTLRALELRKGRYEKEIIEVKHIVAKLRSDLKVVQAEEDEAIAEDEARNKWQNEAKASRYGALSEEQEYEKEERVQSRLHRFASISVMEAELRQNETRRKIWTNMLSDAGEELKYEIMEQKRRVEQRRKQDQADARFRDCEECLKDPVRWKERKRMDAEFEASVDAAEERNRSNASSAYERAAEMQREQNAEKQRQEEEKEKVTRRMQSDADRIKKQEEDIVERINQMKNRAGGKWSEVFESLSGKARPSTGFKLSMLSCQHGGSWDKTTIGDLKRKTCGGIQWYHLFQCLDCGTLACANCWVKLRFEKSKTGK